MAEVGKAWVSAELKSDNIPDQVRQMGGRIESEGSGVMGKVGHRLGAGLGAAMKTAVAGAAVGVAAAGAFGLAAIKSASDLGETVSKSNVIFGEAAAASLRGLADGASAALGLSERAYLDYASGYGNMLTNIGGLTQEAAAKQAAELTTLTADIASFNNDTTDNVAAAVTSALTGEFEPLKKYGVVINDATLKAKALELGLLDSNGAMSTQAKQAATLALVMDQTATAQGDFARTSDGAANQSKILGAQLENLKSDLGQKLLPVAVKVLGFFNDIFPKIAAVAGPAVDKVIGIVNSFKQAFVNNDGDVTSSGVAGQMEKFGYKVRQIVDQVREWWPKIQEVIGQVATAVAAVFSWLQNVGLPAAQSFIAGLIAAFQEAWPKVQEALLRIQEFVAGLIESFRAAWPEIKQVMDDIVIIVQRVVDFVTFLWGKFGDDIIRIIQIAWATISGVIEGAMDVIRGIVAVFAGVLTGDWDKAWNGVKTILSGALDIIKALVSGAFDTVVLVISGIGGRIKSAASGMFDGIKDAFRSAINWIIRKWNGLEFTIGGGSFMGQDIPSKSFGTPDIREFHEGGVVPGRYGQEVLAILEAGETVRTRDQEAALGRGIHIENFHQANRPLLEEMAELEARYGVLV